MLQVNIHYVTAKSYWALFRIPVIQKVHVSSQHLLVCDLLAATWQEQHGGFDSSRRFQGISVLGCYKKYHRLGDFTSKHLFLPVRPVQGSPRSQGQHGWVLLRAFFLHMMKDQRERQAHLSFLIKALIPSLGLHLYNVITSPRPHPQVLPQ